MKSVIKRNQCIYKMKKIEIELNFIRNNCKILILIDLFKQAFKKYLSLRWIYSMLKTNKKNKKNVKH